jgi:hypothetical protein
LSRSNCLLQIFRNETNSLFKWKENLRFFNEITNENIPALIPDRPSMWVSSNNYLLIRI